MYAPGWYASLWVAEGAATGGAVLEAEAGELAGAAARLTVQQAARVMGDICRKTIARSATLTTHAVNKMANVIPEGLVREAIRTGEVYYDPKPDNAVISFFTKNCVELGGKSLRVAYDPVTNMVVNAVVGNDPQRMVPIP